MSADHSTLLNCWIVFAKECATKSSITRSVRIQFSESSSSFTFDKKFFQRLHWDDYQEFVPVVDGPGGVIPDVPEDLAKHRKKVPMMLGTTKDESSLRIC